MIFAPKEIKQETGESLVYNPHRTLVSKEFTFDAAHHLFHYEGKMQIPARSYLSFADCCQWIF